MKDICWKELSGFEKFIFAIGWLGALNAVFWIAMVIVYYTKINKKVNKKYLYFFNPHTYKVAYVFGWIYFVLFILLFLLVILGTIFYVGLLRPLGIGY